MNNSEEVFYMLQHLNESVQIGGFRQWLEDANGEDADEILSFLESYELSQLPKTLKIIEKVLGGLVIQRLHTEDALIHGAFACDVCIGRSKLDDDCSICPACNGEGLIWRGAMIRNEPWINLASKAYLSLPYENRKSEITNWYIKTQENI